MHKKQEVKRLYYKKHWGLPIVIFFFALAVRLVILLQLSDSPIFFTPIIDSGSYDELARSIAGGAKIGGSLFWQPVFYPLFFLSKIYSVTNNSILCAKLIQAGLGSLLCVLVYRLAQRIFDSRTGVLAALITACYGPLLFFESELLATGWAAIWSVVLILVFLRAAERKNLPANLLLGICGALSILTRPTFVPFFVAGAVWLAVSLRRGQMRPKTIAAKEFTVLTGLALTIVPVCAMAFLATGSANPLPRSGPLNLYIGNNPQAQQTTSIRPGREWTKLTALAIQTDAEDVDGQRYFLSMVRDYVTGRPGHYLAGLGRKAVQFTSSREIPRNFDIYLFREYSGLLSLLSWKKARFGFPFGLLLPLAVIGMIRCGRRIPGPVFLFVILYPLAIILVFVAGRYRLPIVGVLAVCASAGCWSLVETIKTRRWRKTIVMAAAIVGMAVLSSIAGPFPAENYNYAAEMHYWVGSVKNHGQNLPQAESHLGKAVQLNPDYSAAHYLLGRVLYKQGRPEQALGHLEKALKLKAELKVAHYHIGSALLELGQTQRAIEQLQKALSYAEVTQNPTLAAEAKAKLRQAGTNSAADESNNSACPSGEK